MIQRINAYLGKDSKLRAQVIGYAIVGILQGIVFAMLVPVLSALLTGDLRTGRAWLIALVLTAAVAGVVLWVVSVRGFWLSIGVLTDGLMRVIGDHVATLPLGWFGKDRAGQVASTLTVSVTNVMNVPSVFLQQMTVAITTPATVIVVMLFVDWRMALALVAITPLAYLAYRNVQEKGSDSQIAEGRSQAKVASRVIEFAQVQPVLRASGKTRQGWHSLDEVLLENRDDTVQTLRKQGRPMLGYMLTVEAGYAIALAFGTLLALGGHFEPATLIALLVMAVRFVEPLTIVGAYGAAIRIANNSISAIGEILEEAPLSQPTHPQTPSTHDVTIDRVTFGYTDRPVLRELSLSAPEHSMTALVGPSGSGKSTITRLIARFWDVDSGAITIGGVDVREMSSEQLMSRISMVFQQVYLFDSSVLDNVRVGRPDATDEEVFAAARAARLDEVVERLPNGWQTQVGEGGNLLSGGERQRVAIARAFLKDAPILLIDEATSALDGENEAVVTRSLADLAKNRTVFVIAHRLSTIAAADQIAVLNEGSIVETGTHEQLLARGGLYHDFWQDRITASRWQVTE